MESVEGKVALVTGSTSGIGLAIARALSGAGFSVVLNSARSVEAGEREAEVLHDARYVQGDISLPDDCRRIVAATVGHRGRLDVLVNNAARTRVIPHHDLDAVTPEVWEEILGTNVIGTWNMIQAAAPALRQAEGGGAVVNVTSVAGGRGGGSSLPYAVSKAALNHMTLLLAAALGPQVRCNAVAPGLIDTPWTADWTDLREAVQARVPARRVGQPDDVAAAVLMVATNSYMTGDLITVDGGLSALP